MNWRKERDKGKEASSCSVFLSHFLYAYLFFAFLLFLLTSAMSLHPQEHWLNRNC